MQKILNHAVWTTHALLLARILMGALFVVAGVQKLQNIEMVTGYIGSVGLPAAALLAWLSSIVEIAAGAAIILGYYFKEAALTLVVFVLLTSFFFHNPSTWNGEMGAQQQMMFLKNMAIAAGLLFMAAHGAGNTWKLKLGK